MFGLRFIHFDAMDHVIHYQNGRIQKSGKGLSFLYFAPTSSIVCIPATSRSLPFSFSEITKDYQPITIQGELSWRVESPQKLAEVMDFTIDKNKKYRSDDIEKLPHRLENEVHTNLSVLIQKLDICESLHSLRTLESYITAALKGSKVVQMLGIEILKVNILEIKPSDEVARALETQTREALQLQADQAIYERQQMNEKFKTKN